MLDFLLGILAPIALVLFPQAHHADILFAGDAMQHAAQIEAAHHVDGSYRYDDCFARISPTIKSADYAVVNLEAPLGGAPYRGYPCFSAPDSYAKALSDAGFDLMLTANNHVLDCRDRGLRRTYTKLDSIGTPHIGTYLNSAQRDTILPFIADINGFKVAFLNYTYGTNGFQVQGDVVVDYIDRKLMASDIAKARKAGAEIVCVAVHWGVEYQLLPHSTQKDLAAFLQKQGVDIIFGGHPHVIQPMEMRVDPATGKRTALIYSLGNFISNMKTRDTRGGAIANVRLSRDSIGQAFVQSMDYRLIFTTPPQHKGDNFIVSIADDSIAPAWRHHRDDFARSARAIFSKHNIDVPERQSN